MLGGVVWKGISAVAFVPTCIRVGPTIPVGVQAPHPVFGGIAGDLAGIGGFRGRLSANAACQDAGEEKEKHKWNATLHGE
jgi:hypothetical protein